MKPRYHDGAYRGCKWCYGKGCVCCEAELNKEYERQFPNGPEPIAVFNPDDPTDMERARETIGAEALKKAFGPGGGGVGEIMENLERGSVPVSGTLGDYER